MFNKTTSALMGLSLAACAFTGAWAQTPSGGAMMAKPSSGAMAPKMSDKEMATMKMCKGMSHDAMMKDQKCMDMMKMHPDAMKMDSGMMKGAPPK